MTEELIPLAVRMCIVANVNRTQIKADLREHKLPEILQRIQERVEGGFFSTWLQMGPIMAEILREEKFDVTYSHDKQEGQPIYLIRWDHPKWMNDGTDPKASSSIDDEITITTTKPKRGQRKK